MTRVIEKTIRVAEVGNYDSFSIDLPNLLTTVEKELPGTKYSDIVIEIKADFDYGSYGDNDSYSAYLNLVLMRPKTAEELEADRIAEEKRKAAEKIRKEKQKIADEKRKANLLKEQEKAAKKQLDHIKKHYAHLLEGL